MENEKNVRSRAESWLGNEFDNETRKIVRDLLDNKPKELEECFYKNLDFGTGGLRGIMGVGTNRMNKYTVGMATQGLANYIKSQFANTTELRAAIAYDNRNNSQFFAEVTAGVLAANGIKVYLFNTLKPTPELSFAVRLHKCQTGVMVTASHNPKEYNGYKVYWDDGAQVTAPHDTNIIAEVNKINSVSDVKFSGQSAEILTIGEETDKIYLEKLQSLSLSPEAISKNKSMKIVYTPLHGAGVKLVPQFLNILGFNNIIHVPEQDINDGNFPTVESPNPEEASALKMAIEKAEAEKADLVMATDPDADRVGIAVRNSRGQLQLLNGNQTAAVLTYYILQRTKETGKLKQSDYIVKTIVTTELLKKIAAGYGIDCFNVLTGFKYIAEIIREQEGKRKFICGGEESYGFLIGDFVRDKDAVVACGMVAEAAAWAQEQGKSLYDLLLDIYVKYGLYSEKLVSLTKKGIDGLREIQNMMADYRANPIKQIDGSAVTLICDYKTSKQTDLTTGTVTQINQPSSDVLQYYTADGTVVSVRPSGTEPKIKFYFGMRGELKNQSDYDKALNQLDEKYKRIIEELKLN